MKVTIKPCLDVSGTVAAPPSKSMAHRYLICAGLADGTSRIGNIAVSEDILATMDCLCALGADIQYSEADMTAVVNGIDPFSASGALMPCRESASTMRFMLPVCALSAQPVTLTGSSSLMRRPMKVYMDTLKDQGILIDRAGTGLKMQGGLKGGEFTLPGDISSQFVSGLMFALPLCKEDSIIRITGDVKSRPYIDMTMEVLKDYGVWTGWQDESSIAVPGGQYYKASDHAVEGDWSSAANLLAIGAEVSGLNSNSLQGDRVCIDLLKQLDEGRADIDISDCPDLGPVLMAYAALHHGCTLHGTGRLRFKESDRGSAMKEELEKTGVKVEIKDDDILVGCVASTPVKPFCGHNDHRIVMALAVICAKTGGMIEGAEAVSKSFPDYFARLSELGVNVIQED